MKNIGPLNKTQLLSLSENKKSNHLLKRNIDLK